MTPTTSATNAANPPTIPVLYAESTSAETAPSGKESSVVMDDTDHKIRVVAEVDINRTLG
jgi:hypothetical protein